MSKGIVLLKSFQKLFQVFINENSQMNCLFLPMPQRLKSYIAGFFLLSFLLPSVVIQIHAVHHEKKIHCIADGGNHLHPQHHECSFCDAVLPLASEPPKTHANFLTPHFAEYLFSNLIEVYASSSHFSSAQLRAPPVC